MNKPVEAGMIEDGIKNLPKLFDKIFDFAKDEDSSYKVIDREEIKDNGDSYSYIEELETRKGNKFKCKVIRPKKDNSSLDCNLYLLADNNKKASYEDIDYRNVKQYINKFTEEVFDEVYDYYYKDKSNKEEEFDKEFNGEVENEELEEAEEVNQEEARLAASKVIQAKFTKIQGSEEITLDAIYCNYEPVEVYEDLNEVTESDIFEELMEDSEDAYIQIDVTDDGYDIKEIDEEDMQENELNSMLSDIYAAQIVLYVLLNHIELKLGHNNIDYIHDLREKLWMINDEMGVVASMLSIGSAAYDCNHGPQDVLRDTLVNTDWGSTIANGTDLLLVIEQYCMVLDLYYPNLPHELQQLVNGWLASLRFDAHRY